MSLLTSKLMGDFDRRLFDEPTSAYEKDTTSEKDNIEKNKQNIVQALSCGH